MCASTVTGESETALTDGSGPALEGEVLPSVVVSASMVRAEPVPPSEAQSSAGMSPTVRSARPDPRMGPDRSSCGQPGPRRTGGDLLPSRGRQPAPKMGPDRSSRGQPGPRRTRGDLLPSRGRRAAGRMGPDRSSCGQPGPRRTGGDLLPSRGRRAAGRMGPDRSSRGQPGPRRTGGDLLPSRGRRAVRPGNRQLSGLRSHALPRIGRARPWPVRRSWAGERSLIPAEELEKPAALRRRRRGFRVSQRTRDEGRSALERGWSTFAGRLSRGQKHRPKFGDGSRACPDLRWSESCLFPFRSFRVKGTSGNGPSHGDSLHGSASRPR